MMADYVDPQRAEFILTHYPKKFRDLESVILQELPDDQLVLLLEPSRISQMPDALTGFWVTIQFVVSMARPTTSSGLPRGIYRLIARESLNYPTHSDPNADQPVPAEHVIVGLFPISENFCREFQRFLKMKRPIEELLTLIQVADNGKGIRELTTKLKRLTYSADSVVSDVMEVYAENTYDHWQAYAGDGIGLLEELDIAGSIDASNDGSKVHIVPAADEPIGPQTYGMMKAIGAVIRDTCSDAGYLPAVRSFAYSAGKCGPEYTELQKIFEILPVIFAKDNSPWSYRALVIEIFNTFWLPAILRLFAASTGVKSLLSVIDHETGSFLEKISLRESRFVFHEQNWQSINDNPHVHPFLWDEHNVQFDIMVVRTSSAEDAESTVIPLARILGFSPLELDLTECGITGSTASFVLGRNFRPVGHNTLVAKNVPDWVVNRATVWSDFKRQGDNDFRAQAKNDQNSEIFSVSHAHDIDIAVFTRDPAVLEKVAAEAYAVFLRHYPDVTLERREKGKHSFTWHIVAGKDSFLRLPPVEFYRTSLAGVCSHHVAPARACFTAAFQHPERVDLPSTPRWLLTTSAIRAYHTGLLDNFYYFASRFTFPQEIIAKYIARGYKMSEHVPMPVRHEVLNYVIRHPSKLAGAGGANFRDFQKHVADTTAWLEMRDDIWHTCG